MPVKLHDASAYMTLLNNCDLIERPPTPEQPLTRKEQRERDILASKQAHIRAREQEYARQLQSSKVRSQRKLEAANAQKAQELEHQYTALLDARKEGGWIKQLQDEVEEHDARQLRKQELLHAQWLDNVFNPIQSQINGQIGTSNPEMVRFKRHQKRELCGLKPKAARRESRKSLGDSLAADLPAVAPKVSYSVRAVHDPLRALKGPKFPGRKASERPNELVINAKDNSRIDLDMWQHAEGTIGRWNRRFAEDFRADMQPSHVESMRADHYDFPTGDASWQVLKKEWGSSKRVTGPIIPEPSLKQGGKKIVGSLKSADGLLG